MGLARKIGLRVSGRNRERKMDRFMEICRPTSQTRVLDVGFSDHEYGPNDNYIERHYPWPHNLTALGICESVECRSKYPEVTFVRYDGTYFPFETSSFDIAWSNAVLEHVGDLKRQELFIRELTRVARRVWVTTPSRRFPVDTHTLIPVAHWFPKNLRDGIYRLAGKPWATGDRLNLLYKRDLQRILRAADVTEYRIITNRILLWPVDYVAIIEARRI